MNRETPELQDLIAGIVDEFTEAIRRGDEIEVETIANRYPDYASQIRSTLETLIASVVLANL